VHVDFSMRCALLNLSWLTIIDLSFIVSQLFIFSEKVLAKINGVFKCKSIK